MYFSKSSKEQFFHIYPIYTISNIIITHFIMKQKSKQIKLTLVLTILLSFISEANTIFASGTTNPRDNMFTYLGTSIQGILNFNPFLNTDNQNSLNGVDTSQAGLLPNGQIKGNN